MQPTLTDLQTWAAQAGKILLDGYGQDHQVTYKGRIDLVTEMDRRSEDYLVEQIRARFPEHEILAEESGRLNGRGDHLWIIDPLDGTTNYAHGLPIFAVSLAYAHRGEVTLGVVYDPTRDECFSAERGRGAWLNGRPIRVSGTARLIESLLVTGFPYEVDAHTPTNMEYFARFQVRARGLRRLGSAALDLCYVACGRLDGYWELSLGAWDMAAGALIAEEAGAKITDITGSPTYLKPPYDAIVANPVLHEQMLAVIRGAA